MKGLIPYTINVGGKLLDLSEPRVMGILNVTPDSFYADSRKQEDEQIEARVHQICDEGGDIIDIGAYSSRPGAGEVSKEEEEMRLRHALTILRRVQPEAIVSVDTFRADIAKMCVEEYGVQIVNDISAGEMDKEMFPTVASLGVPYVMMHMQGTPQNMQKNPHYENMMKEIMLFLARKIQQLRDLKMKDIIIDPGFGFGKTLDHNYELMNHLNELKIFELPILVGVSRKSMIYKLTGGTADDALNGTSVLNAIALTKGANILRVHDVKQCVETVKIVNKITG